ncbi:heterokaryon incompatibility protein-domain-containing protein [Leptodontidium sp. MPI-SDFR-AT-0119]|nr:heterokaryon incompatibility protein-domain-containing protein [Leptodontidium sp. MPI-SDFR-AT-0119]
MRLLQYNNDGDFTQTEFFEGDIPKKYAILSHRWGAEEVTLADLKNGNCKRMAGYSKIQFCGEQAKRDGLQYFWVDTCCIDKSNSTELAEAINSMFRWYQHATKCYVYLPDVSRPRTNSADGSNEDWVSIFRKSEWFRRGWTLQELIAPASVDFFWIPTTALGGSVLSDFSVAERMSWTEYRETTYEKDKAYSLLGIFDVYIPLIYGEKKDRALTRLREKIDKASRGFKHEDFSVSFSLSDISDVEHFVARKTELVEIHKALGGNGSRRRRKGDRTSRSGDTVV